MIAGKKILAIFGFVGIRFFAETTEILEESIMIFANEIAEIVHSVCDQFHGSANKNLGDCFLMVWRFRDKDDMIELVGDDINIKNHRKVNNFSDCALVGYLKTIIAIRKLSLTASFVS